MRPETKQSRLEAPGAVLQVELTANAIPIAFERYVGIHLSRWRILMRVYDAGSCTQKELAQAQLVHGGSITRLVQDLEEQGYLRRERDPQDNRLSRVALTAAGRELVRRLLPRRDAVVGIGLRGLSAGDLQQLQASLGRILRNLSEAGLLPDRLSAEAADPGSAA